MNVFNNALKLSLATEDHDENVYGSAHRLAEQSTIRTLLNCYIREVASPRKELEKYPEALLIQTLPLGWRQRQRNCCWLVIKLEHSQQQIIVAVSRHTLLGNYRYAFPVLGRSLRANNAAWAELDAMQLANWLVADLCEAEAAPFNLEFIQQIRLSLENTTEIQRHNLSLSSMNTYEEDLYLFSEQSLSYGHAFHPTPKSRQWPTHENEADYAPEYRGDFQLHWFRVRADLLRCETVAPLRPEQLHKDICPLKTRDSGKGLLPLHPAQARYVLTLPATQQAIADGLIEYLGAAGEPYAATASVRTLYNRNNPWFIKGSLNVRITNCVRKNAIYELETALALHRRLQVIKPDLQAQHTGFRLLSEPGFMTLQLPDIDALDNTLIQEGFGLVVRENIHCVLADDEQAVMAGALFQEGSPLANKVPIIDKAVWLDDYARAIIPPMLQAFFEHGVIFEPHLQNTVICLRNNRPSGVVVRDFEGVKLVDSYWPVSELTDLSERAQSSVRYSFEQGWNRVRYCLLINNLSEAVNYLANNQESTESQLWDVIEQVIHDYQQASTNPLVHERLEALLSGEPIPSKTNLLVRINKRPDREAGYVYLNNPFNPFDK
ncbi:IucA/IucC family protein [Aliamphritea ceti]|uniref:IucA/IucC family protein n=1 Tax=Aliamphritea ceti TaxID=1524258 RepID=UPI0021C293D0|nr:IucA/IucC family protein [Aliamphritea ceti]